MSAKERRGFRSLIYSLWHRAENTRRYLGIVRATQLGMIDVDGLEYCALCSEPLALIETTRASAHKQFRVMQRLGQRADLPAYAVYFAVSHEAPTCTSCGKPEEDGIEPVSFRVEEPTGSAVDMSPSEYAEWLWALRAAHQCPNRKAA